MKKRDREREGERGRERGTEVNGKRDKEKGGREVTGLGRTHEP